MKSNLHAGLPLPLAIAMLATLLTTLGHAKTAVLWLEGRPDPLKGELVSQTPDQVTIRIAGINTPIDRGRIVRIEYELSLREQYEQRRAALAEDNYDARYDLARWLYRMDEPLADKLARQELRSLVKDQPDLEQAELLLQLVNQRVEQRRRAEEAAESRRPDPDGGQDGGDGKPDGDDGQPQRPRYLTDAQRNLLKVMEINLETDPRVVVPRKTAEAFLEAYRDDPVLDDFAGRRGRARFQRLPGHRQLEIMFEARAREFYDQTIVNTEPAPLQQFRQKWGRGLVAGHCGSCHNPRDKAPGLALFTRNAASEEVAYTNFLILHRATANGRPLINRDPGQAARARSLLVQFALPRDDADVPHPEAEGFTPFFRGKDDRRYQQLIDWIGSLYPSATYAIGYRLPGAERSEQPQGPAEERATEGGAEQAGEGAGQ